MKKTRKMIVLVAVCVILAQTIVLSACIGVLIGVLKFESKGMVIENTHREFLVIPQYEEFYYHMRSDTTYGFFSKTTHKYKIWIHPQDKERLVEQLRYDVHDILRICFKRTQTYWCPMRSTRISHMSRLYTTMNTPIPMSWGRIHRK